jgi:putative spermidine/putrescine transport system substrate-binding protein
MIRLPRRGLLAAAALLPGLSRARAQAMGDLSLVIAGESRRLGASVLDDVLHNHGLSLPAGEVRHEMVPWIAAELQDEVEAGLPGTDAVITNAAGFALGATHELWRPLPASLLAANTPRLTPTGQLVQARLGDLGLVLGAMQGGPVLLHRRAVLPVAPRNAAELLSYTQQNPGRFQYSRPAQSRFGQAFVTGIPHLLRDMDPLDPEGGWTRSWPYLAELGRYSSYYPSSGGAAVEEFLDGGVDLMPALLGPYLLGMATGLLPGDLLCTPFDDAPLVPNSLILVVPRGVPAERLPLLAPLVEFLGHSTIQRLLFGRGLLPGSPARDVADPAAPNVPDADVQDRLWTEALTPALSAALTGRETAPPLSPAAETAMLRLWDDRVGARYGETR